MARTPFTPCCYCGCGFTIDQLRPYGKDGGLTCFQCSQLPENIEAVHTNFADKLNKIVESHKVPVSTECGIVGLSMEEAIATKYSKKYPLH